MYIAMNIDDAKEQKPAPKGAYELQVTGAQVMETGPGSKHPGAPMIKVTLGFTDLEVNAPVITHFITLPYEGDENAAFKVLMLRRFLVAFGVPYSSEGIDVDDISYNVIGKTAKLEVTLTEPNDNGDVFNRVIIPRIRDEVAGGKGRPPARKRA